MNKDKLTSEINRINRELKVILQEIKDETNGIRGVDIGDYQNIHSLAELINEKLVDICNFTWDKTK
jgi:hypothetical protein